MDDKRTPELSDEALDLVAGGLSMGSSLPGTTYSTSGPSAAGPGAGTGNLRDTVGRDSSQEQSLKLSGTIDSIITRLIAAGTIEQYQRDLDEYHMQHDEWEKKCALGGAIDPCSIALAGPEPVPPNPHDYL